MKFHLIGKNFRTDRSSARQGTSLAVLQWMELLRGERPAMEPQNRFEVRLVLAEDRYCTGCFKAWTHDVAYSVGFEAARRCRSCGKESGECLMGNR